MFMYHVKQSCLNEQKYFKILASTFIGQRNSEAALGKIVRPEGLCPASPASRQEGKPASSTPSGCPVYLCQLSMKSLYSGCLWVKQLEYRQFHRVRPILLVV